MSNSTNTVVHFDGKGSNLFLCLRSHPIYAAHVCCSIFQPAKFEQTITHQHVLLWQENLIDWTAVTIIMSLHVLIAHHIFYDPKKTILTHSGLSLSLKGIIFNKSVYLIMFYILQMCMYWYCQISTFSAMLFYY
jgi:hypothetical protein